MGVSLLTILAIGIILGVRHAIEPDHVIAVSTIASQNKTLWRSSLAGVFWGMGHTATLFIVGMVLIVMKGQIREEWSLSLEFLVGIMLVYLGVTSIRAVRKIHVHEHTHDGVTHKHFHKHTDQELDHGHQHRDVSYIKSMLIGLVHGLAGSAAMVLLTMSTVDSIWGGMIYILVFGAGTVAGMLMMTTVIGIPFVLSAGRASINKYLAQLTGAISITFGFYYMYYLGITEGMFKMWIQ